MLATLRAAIAALALLAAPAIADRGDDIRAVIAAQLDAFTQDDWSRAFAYASPTIRGMFGTPENFGRMVRGGYPMVWRPARVEFGAVEDGGRGPVQVVHFVDGAGEAWVAAYEMRRVDGAWRINGVRIRRAPGAGV